MVERTNPGEGEDTPQNAQPNPLGVDQSRHNVPIDPDLHDMLDLLELKMKELKLTEDQQEILKVGL
jgi:hypothetical protein